MAQAQGVNVVGFFRAEFGQGEAARRVLLALRQAGVPYSAISYDRVPHRQEHPFEANGKPEYAANLLCLNAEHLLQFVQDGGAALLRREMLAGLGGLDEGYHLYGEDIDLAYRACRAGWERWYVPDAVVVHHHQAVTDRSFFTRRTLWHWRSIARFVRKHPETLRAL